MVPPGVMGVIIAVIIWPNGAGFVVIPERYPLQGARSSRLTAAEARNAAPRGVWGTGPPRSGGAARVTRWAGQAGAGPAGRGCAGGRSPSPWSYGGPRSG